jgi:hypothetical protein
MAVRSAKKRWSALVPDEISEPKGAQECLNRAVERLGPYKHRTHREAKEAGQYDGLDGRVSLSAELAIDQTIKLAKSYNEQVHLAKAAPRTKDVAENLMKLHAFAHEMANLIESFDDMTRHRLHTLGSGIAVEREIQNHPKATIADIDGLPKVGETGRWVERLEALSEYAAVCLAVFLQSKNVNLAGTIDKGGNKNLHKDLWGSPPYRLVSDGWSLFDLFKPDEATGTEGGPFHSFLMDVFELATGKDPEEHSHLLYWLKRLVPALRRYKEIGNIQIEIQRELHEWRCAKTDWNKRDDRGSELCARSLSLEQERVQLYFKIYPTSL